MKHPSLTCNMSKRVLFFLLYLWFAISAAWILMVVENEEVNAEETVVGFVQLARVYGFENG
jgi:hypothetical protein